MEPAILFLKLQLQIWNWKPKNTPVYQLRSKSKSVFLIWDLQPLFVVRGVICFVNKKKNNNKKTYSEHLRNV